MPRRPDVVLKKCARPTRTCSICWMLGSRAYARNLEKTQSSTENIKVVWRREKEAPGPIWTSRTACCYRQKGRHAVFYMHTVSFSRFLLTGRLHVKMSGCKMLLFMEEPCLTGEHGLSMSHETLVNVICCHISPETATVTLKLT